MKWASAVKSTRLSSSATRLIGVMVGNKCDYRTDERGDDSRAEVDLNACHAQAKELGLEYFETSAASNIGVTEPFAFIAKEFYRRYFEILKISSPGYLFD